MQPFPFLCIDPLLMQLKYVVPNKSMTEHLQLVGKKSNSILTSSTSLGRLLWAFSPASFLFSLSRPLPSAPPCLSKAGAPRSWWRRWRCFSCCELGVVLAPELRGSLVPSGFGLVVHLAPHAAAKRPYVLHLVKVWVLGLGHLSAFRI